MKDAAHHANLAYWNEAATLHQVSYDAAALVQDPAGLSGVVKQDATLLAPFLPSGTVNGLDMVHLQCHIGTDTLSWARLGARLTGVDFSPESLRVARELSAAAGVDIEYIQSTIAAAAPALAGRCFDVVYTSIGVLCWLDNLDQWANLIANLLKPDGKFFIREGHPMAQSLDQTAPAGELRLAWPYFNCGAVAEQIDRDYSSPAKLTNTSTYEWAHPLSEVIGSLLGAGLKILDFQEHRTVPWAILPWMPEASNTQDHVLPDGLADLCPLTFSLVATPNHGP